MKYIGILKSGMVILMLFLVGCGGGGGDGDASPSTPSVVTIQTPTTKINGIASKGPINAGIVSAYKIANSAKGDLIVSSATGADGLYSLDLGAYTGPVLLEISGGTYTDEATGKIISVATPLHAVVSSASGTVSAAITPFTELAYQLIGYTLTPAAIDSGNKQVSDILKIYDIIKTQPVSPIKSMLDALPTTIQGQDQRDYTLAIATFSQVVSTQNMSVADTISYLKNNISSSALTTTAATVIQNAAATFFSPTNTNNKTGVTDISSTNLIYIGAKQVIVKLSTIGTIPNGNSIKGMQFEFNLPAGVSVKSDANGVLASYLLASGVAPTSTSMIFGNTITGSKLSISFLNNSGIAAGEFATLTCDVAYNSTIPTIGSFSISSGYKVEDLILNSGTINLSAVVVIAVSSVTVK